MAGAHAVISAAAVPNVHPVPPNSGKSWETTTEFGIVEAAPDAEIIETAVLEAPGPTAERAAPIPYADRGDYLPDGVKRFPLDTRENAKRAWLALREDATARRYTAAQLKRVRGRTVKALTEFGVYADPAAGWLIETRTPVVTEGVMGDSPGFGGAYRICLTNGPTEVSVCCWQLDPHDLDAVGRAAMAGALAAIKAIDPDLDADIDITPDGAETAPASAVETTTNTDSAMASPGPAAPTNPDPATDEDYAVAEEPTTNPTDMIGKLVAAIAAAPAPRRPRRAGRRDHCDTARCSGCWSCGARARPGRRHRVGAGGRDRGAAHRPPGTGTGHRPRAGLGRIRPARHRTKGPDRHRPGTAPSIPGGTDVNEHGLPAGWPNKLLHEYSEAEFSRYAFPQLESYVLNGRVPRG